MGYFIQAHTESGLWEAFHDAEILRLELDAVAQCLEIELEADFPYPPEGAASVIGLTFEEVAVVEMWRAEPVQAGDEHVGETVWKYVPYSLSEFRAALIEDPPANLCVAGVTFKPAVTFGFEASFLNIPLYVACVIRAKTLIVAADGKPSSLDEWMEWGTAGWEAFGEGADSHKD